MIKTNIRKAYSLILVVQVIFIYLGILLAVQIFYQRYTDLVYMQAETMLDLYSQSIERKLENIEQDSYMILSDQNLQGMFEIINNAESQYDAYRAEREITESLTNYLAGIDDSNIITFVSLNGEQTSSYYRSKKRISFSEEELAHLLDLAQSGYGKGMWSYSMEQEEIYLVRMLRENINGRFYALGTLIITCPMEKIFSYKFPTSYGYTPLVIVSDSERNITSNDGTLNEAFPVLDLKGSPGIREIAGEEYYCIQAGSDLTQWNYSSYIANRDILGGIQLLRWQSLILLFIVLIFSLVVSSKFSALISARIEHLSKKMEDVKNGKYRFHPEPEQKLSIYEIQALDKSFEYMTGEIDHLINDVYRNQIMLQEMQYRMLQSQINPHFIYNTLETVNSMAKQHGEKEISLAVCSLSRMLRSSLSAEQVIPLPQEIKLLRDYIAIQKLRFEERLDFRLEEGGDFSGVEIPKMTLQPIVENSINYGLERLSQVCVIRVGIGRDGETIRITVTDNGPGMSQERIRGIFTGEITPKKTGLGIKNVNERIKYTFGREYGIQFESVPGKGTTAIITIPDKYGI